MTAADPQRQFALDVVKKLRGAGYEALWAGGCVRDQLLGLRPKDYDVATNAPPDEVRTLFGRRHTLAIGAAFGVIAVRGGAVSPIDVATFRTDGKYRDGRHPESIEFTTAEHDAQRRDFTINGLFFDPIGEQVIDYVDGLGDLEARVVRAIGDPSERFAEDRLRMLRAVRFAATYDFSLEATTLHAIRGMAEHVSEVSGERIGAELRRVLVHPNRRRGVELLVETDLLRHLLPQVALGAAADGAAWQATLIRLGRLVDPTWPAALAALLHVDASLPHVDASLPNVDASLRDANEVSEKLRQTTRQLRLSNKESERTLWLLQRLDQVLAADKLSWPQLQRLLAHPASAELMSLAEASLPQDHPALARCRRELSRPTHELDPHPLVTGDDLIAQGFKAGRHFAALLEHLRDEQLEGRLLTREEAIAAARRWVEATRDATSR